MLNQIQEIPIDLLLDATSSKAGSYVRSVLATFVAMPFGIYIASSSCFLVLPWGVHPSRFPCHAPKTAGSGRAPGSIRPCLLRLLPWAMDRSVEDEDEIEVERREDFTAVDPSRKQDILDCRSLQSGLADQTTVTRALLSSKHLHIAEAPAI